VNRTDTPQGSVTSSRIATLAAGPGSDEVTLRHYLRMSGEIRSDELATLKPGDLRRTEGCDYHFERRADHFRGLQRPKTCRFDWEGSAVYTDNEISLSRDDLFVHDHKYRMSDGKRITGVASGDPYWLERARIFLSSVSTASRCTTRAQCTGSARRHTRSADSSRARSA
jgi:hypothetical protein